MSSKKRHISLANPPRLPLKETSGNIVSPQVKRAKVDEENDQKRDDKRPGVVKVIKGRLVGDELVQWQQQWRRIMRDLTVFFDGTANETNPTEVSEFCTASKYLRQLGCRVAAFYDVNVSIIVSRRKYDDQRGYPLTDIFSLVASNKIKVWDYDKVFRFLKNLGINVDPSAAPVDGPEGENNLYTLLKEEKIYGATERDPTAKREDFHYLENNYVFVYDLAHKTRPVAVREWKEGTYPRLHNTIDGKCPFVGDLGENNDKRRARRLQKFELNKDYRHTLRLAADRLMKGEMITSEDGGDNESTVIQPSLTRISGDDAEPTADTVHAPPPLPRELSCVLNRGPLDVMALGYNGALNLVLVDLAALSGGNGLGPMVSQVTSRNLNNLKRRIIKKKQQQQNGGREKKKEETSPGYCENCRVKYDSFNDHIYSSRHRRFAADDRNFEDIDALIATLRESSAIGGAYSHHG